jgi:hypothetical protein
MAIAAKAGSKMIVVNQGNGFAMMLMSKNTYLLMRLFYEKV